MNKEPRSKPLICFIDDNPDERKLFQDVFGCTEGAFRVIIAETFAEAKMRIEEAGEIPALFVLDLYFPGGGVEAVPEVNLEDPVIFQDDEGDLIKAYMNLETARKRYQAIRIAQDQSPAGGLQLIRQVQEAFPGVPAVTYTRKGTIEEAETARRTGVRFVLQKPSGGDWEDTLKITRQRRRNLELSFQRAITLDPYELLNQIVQYAWLETSLPEKTDIAREVLRIRRALSREGKQTISDEDADRLMGSTNHPFIRALIFQLRNAAY